MVVISVAIEKGGAGKTTTVWGLGGWLHSIGCSVLYVDMDPQGTLSYLLDADTSKPTIYDVLTGATPLRRSVQHTYQGDLIRGSSQMGGLDAVLSSTGREYRLKEALRGLPDLYDVVFIDTPPGVGISVICSLTASDGVIIPMRSDVVTLPGLESLLASIGSVQRYTNPALEVMGIVLTDWDGRPALSRQVREFIEGRAANIPAPVLGAVRHGIAIQEAQAEKRSLGDYSPRSKAAEDMASIGRALAARIGI